MCVYYFTILFICMKALALEELKKEETIKVEESKETEKLSKEVN